MTQRFFSYDPDDEFKLHDTLDDARREAAFSLAWRKEQAGDDGWPENTDQICYGELTGAAVLTNSIPRPPASEIDEDGTDAVGNNWSNSDLDWINTFELQAISPEPIV